MEMQCKGYYLLNLTYYNIGRACLDLSKGYLLVKIALCLPFSRLGLLELNYEISGPKLFTTKCS